MRLAGVEHILRGDRAGGIEMNILELVDLRQPPINDAPPFDEIRQLGFEQHAPTCFTLRIDEDDLVSALTQRPCRFQPGRTGTDDEDFIVLLFGRDDLRMPVAPPFFTYRRVLCAANGNEARVTSDADVTANALANVFVPAFFYFIR